MKKKITTLLIIMLFSVGLVFLSLLIQTNESCQDYYGWPFPVLQENKPTPTIILPPEDFVGGFDPIMCESVSNNTEILFFSVAVDVIIYFIVVTVIYSLLKFIKKMTRNRQRNGSKSN